MGGQMILAGLPPHKSIVHEVLNWFRGEVARMNIPVVYNTTVDEAYIDECKPDVVLLAFGALPFHPNIPGMELAKDAWDVLRNQDAIPAGQKALIIGGGTVGCEVAETILAKGGNVAIVEMDDGLNKKQDKVHRDYVHQLFDKHQVEVHLNSTVKAIGENSVTVAGPDGEIAVAADYTVCAVGQRPVRDLAVTDIRSKGIDCYLLGDANEIGDFQTATRSAMDVVMTLG